jgi:Tc toxin complex TcA C-terminal TcB-binding domain/Neuraminidase-like domain/Salmonella virulence plasmid 28.1kDa A protein
MGGAELLAGGDFTALESVGAIEVVEKRGRQAKGRWYLTKGAARYYKGHLRIQVGRSGHLQQTLAVEQSELVLTLKVRVDSGGVQAVVSGPNRTKHVTELPVGVPGSKPVTIAIGVAGPATRISFTATRDDTVFHLWTVSLRPTRAPASADSAAPGPPAGSRVPPAPTTSSAIADGAPVARSRPRRLDQLVNIALPEVKTWPVLSAALSSPAASLDAVLAAVQDKFGEGPQLEAIRLVCDLDVLTRGDEAIVGVLVGRQRDGKLASARVLTGYTTVDWNSVVEAAHPDQSPDQRGEQVERLSKAVRAAYPGAALVAAAKTAKASWVGRPGVGEFFEANPDVDLISTSLRLVPVLSDQPVLLERLQRLQRLARVSAEPAHLDHLYRAGYGSASAITRTGRAAFVAAHAEGLGGRAAATAVYEKAALVSSRAFAVYARVSPAFNRRLPRVLAPAADNTADPVPDWETLFEDDSQLDLLTDDPTRTVFSPAAYLTDLLHFLDQQPLAPSGGGDATPQTGLDVLAQSRSDLLRLALDQSNTNVELPMLDLANELLECAVLARNGRDRQPAWCTSAPPEGTADTAVGPWQTATVTNGDPAPWGPSGSDYHQTPEQGGYHSHGFVAEADNPGLPLAPGDLIGVWVRPRTEAPPTQIVLKVTYAAGDRQLVWGNPADGQGWISDSDVITLGPIPPLCSWRFFAVDAATIGIDGQSVTGLEFGCVDGAVDWGPTGSYPAAPPTTTTGDSASRRAQPQVVLDQAYDPVAGIGGDLYPWSSTPLDLGYRTALLAANALGVDLTEMVAAFTAPDRLTELTDVSIATTLLGIGPQLHKVLLGTDVGSEPAHWGLDSDAGDWLSLLAPAKTFLPRAGLSAAQMRTPPGSVTTPGLALQAAADPATAVDPATGDLDLSVAGLTEVTVPLLRRFLRLWQVLGGEEGPIERFYHSLADDTDPPSGQFLGDGLLTKLAMARRLTNRMRTDLPTIASWWTATLDADGYVDPRVYPDDGPGSVAESPYSRIFLDPTLGDQADVFTLSAGEIKISKPLSQAIPAIAAALTVSAEDLDLLTTSSNSGITSPAAGSPVLNMQALSAIQRAASFTQAAGLSMADYLSLRELTGIDPFDPSNPANTQLLLDATDDTSAAGVSIAELDYLLAGTTRPGSDFSPKPPASDVVTTLAGGMAQLRQIYQVVPDPNGDVLKRDLVAAQSALSLTAQWSPDQVLSAVDGTGYYTVPLSVDPGLTADDLELQLAWQYSELSGGVLTTDDLKAVLGRHADLTVQSAFQALYQQPRAVLGQAVPGLNDPTAIQALLDGSPEPGQRHSTVLAVLVPAVVNALGSALIESALASRSNLNSDVVVTLLDAITTGDGSTARTVLLGLNDPTAPTDPNLAATLVTRFDTIARICYLARLGVDETRFALTQAANTGWVNLLDLPVASNAIPDFAGWQRLAHYAAFRDRVGDNNGALIRIFNNAASPPSDPADLAAAQTDTWTSISALTGWPTATITALHGLFGLKYPDSYRDEQALLRLERAVNLVRAFGADPGRVNGWCSTLGSTATGSDLLAFARATVANPTALQPIEDSLRRLRRDALVNHLFPPNSVIDSGDAALAELLIDTQVDVNRLTTRTAAATQAVQLFVQRSLLDLDTRLVLSDEARQEWSWRDSYTSWSAARQAFVYPENYVVPEARSDQTTQFTALQGQLRQGQLTDDSAQTALLGFLQGLDDIGNLACAALYQETQVDSTTGNTTGTVLHLVARTRATPYHYYYRQRTTLGWTAWEGVGVNIDSENIALYVLDRRLHLFWLQVTGHVDQPTTVPPQPQPKDPVPPPLYETRLAWTTRDVTGWTAKQLSVDSIPTVDPTKYNVIQDDVGQDLIILGTGNTPPGEAVPTLILPVWQSPARQLPDNFGGFELQVFEFVPDTQQATVPPSSVDPKLGIDLEPPYGIEAAPTNPPNPFPSKDPILNYQSWFVRRGLQLPQLGAWPNLLFGTAPDSPNRVLGSTSVTSESLQSGIAVDPTLPFAFEPPGWPMLATPTNYATPVFNNLTYTFELAYHPYTKWLKRAFVTSGVSILFARQTQLEPGSPPSDRAPLNFSALGPTPSVVNTNLAETLDFDSGSFYGTYNWELFFYAPWLIARQLSAAQQFDKAKQWLEYIFDPLDRSSDPTPVKYWQTKPLYNAASQSVSQLLEALNKGDQSAGTEVTAWLADPFDPDMIAVLRPEAYQKATVMDYLDNLIAWGDWYFAQATSETLAAATQMYLFASDLLGPAPLSGPVPSPTTPEVAACSFVDLRLPQLDSFSDPVVALENVLPSDPSEPPGSPSSPPDGPPPAAVLPTGLYFTVPPNPKLQNYWTTVADRLSKLREGLSITGQQLQTSPYPPMGNPADYTNGGAAGGVSTAMARPVYRFPTLIAKAQELAGDVRSLGGALLAALEKQDAETLAALRSTQELAVLRKARAVKESALTEASQQVTQLQAALAVTEHRFQYYNSRGPLNPQELDQVTHLQNSASLQMVAGGLEALGTAFSFIPEATVGLSGVASSPVATAAIGGRELNEAASLIARIVSMQAAVESHLANMASLSGGWARRLNDWQFQTGQAGLEITQINDQIAAAQTRVAQAQQELDDHDLQIANAQQVDDFLHSKYTNAQLYGWMVGQISTVYSNAYRLALAAAQRAEDAFRWELMPDQSTFIQPQSGYWNSLRAGLLAGEQLSYDLRQMEMAFFERNARQLEITKHISLAMADPAALVTLRSTGQCTVMIPEWWFDLDYPGHYLRRMRRVAISIPCVTGPYTGVHCTLSLQADSTRIYPSLANGTTYSRQGQADCRFADRYGLTEAIVTSGGLDQSGTFSAGGDDRFDPFEGADKQLADRAAGRHQRLLPRHRDRRRLAPVLHRPRRRERGSRRGPQRGRHPLTPGGDDFAHRSPGLPPAVAAVPQQRGRSSGAHRAVGVGHATDHRCNHEPHHAGAPLSRDDLCCRGDADRNPDRWHIGQR